MRTYEEINLDDKMSQLKNNCYGELSNDNVDDYIDLWHNSPEIKLSLHEFLGMSPDEYDNFVRTGYVNKK